MLRVDLPQKRSTFTFLPVLLLSIVLHLALYLIIDRSNFDFRNHLVGASRFEFAVREREEVIERIEPEPLKAKDPEPPQPERRIAERPKPNRSNRVPDKPDEQNSKPETPVFGATAESVVAGGTGPAIRVGNTLQKRMEKVYTPPKQVALLKPPPAAPPQPKRFEPVPTYRLSRMPTFKKKVEPDYPEQARRAGIEGTVHLEIWLDETGRIRKIRVLKSPGHGLDRAAIKAAALSKFAPGLVNGKPVKVKITVPYRFVLDA